MKSKWDIGVVSAWEQKKLEASVSTSSTAKKCLKIAQNTQRPMSALLGAGI